MYQDEDENEPEDEFFRSFRIKTVTNEPGPQYYDTLKDRFVRHAQVPERTKGLVFVFVFVFVLAHEQAMTKSHFCFLFNLILSILSPLSKCHAVSGSGFLVKVCLNPSLIDA